MLDAEENDHDATPWISRMAGASLDCVSEGPLGRSECWCAGFADDLDLDLAMSFPFRVSGSRSHSTSSCVEIQIDGGCQAMLLVSRVTRVLNTISPPSNDATSSSVADIDVDCLFRDRCFTFGPRPPWPWLIHVHRLNRLLFIPETGMIL